MFQDKNSELEQPVQKSCLTEERKRKRSLEVQKIFER